MMFSLPTRFYGTLTRDGGPVPAETSITASLQGKPAGNGTVTVSGSVSSYMIDVMATAGASDGSTVTFQVDGNRVRENGKLQAGTFVELNLTAASGSGSPTTATQQSSNPAPAPTPAGQSAPASRPRRAARRTPTGKFSSAAQAAPTTTPDTTPGQTAVDSSPTRNDAGSANQ